MCKPRCTTRRTICETRPQSSLHTCFHSVVASISGEYLINLYKAHPQSSLGTVTFMFREYLINMYDRYETNFLHLVVFCFNRCLCTRDSCCIVDTERYLVCFYSPIQLILFTCSFGVEYVPMETYFGILHLPIRGICSTYAPVSL